MISLEIRQLLQDSLRLVKEYSHSSVKSEHLLLSLLQSDEGHKVALSFGLDVLRAQKALEERLRSFANSSQLASRLQNAEHLSSPALRQLFRRLMLQLQLMRKKSASISDVFLALRSMDDWTSEYLIEHCSPETSQFALDASEKTSTSWMTKLSAGFCQLRDPVIGRQTEVDRLLQTLGARAPRSVCISSRPKTGKTTVIDELLCQLMYRHPYPGLQEAEIHVLDATKAAARLEVLNKTTAEELVDEFKNLTNTILVLDDFHLVLQKLMSLPHAEEYFAQIYLSFQNSSIRVVASVDSETFDSLPKYVTILFNKFLILDLLEFSEADTLTALLSARLRLIEHYDVRIPINKLVECIRVSCEAQPTLPQPHSSLLLLDLAASFAACNHSKTVTDFVIREASKLHFT